MASSADLGDTRGDETTLSEQDWPVDEHYLVEPDPATAAERRRAVDDDATVLVQGGAAAERPRRRFPPDLEPRLFVPLIAALLLVPAAIWLLARGGEEPSAAPPAQVAPPAATEKTTTSTDETVSSATKPVPPTNGTTLAEARSLLQDAGFRVRIRRVAADEPRDQVLRQSPASGSELGPNGIVVLTVSGGPEQVDVPNVIGQTASAATGSLRDMGLRPVIQKVPSTRPAGTVIRQLPSGGKEVDPKTVVNLQVAAPPPTVDVPSLVGLTSSEARGRLSELGLRWIVTEVESPEPKGTVVGQSPTPGADRRKGQAVTLRVSSGPATIAIPSVVGLDEQSARQQMESAGFQVEVVDEATTDPSQDGLVTRQSPSGGTSRVKGSIVSLTVARSADTVSED
jgi:beta-lactam-binding protein with PASTA domain